VAAATINIINHIIGLGIASFAIVEDGKLKFLRIEGYENFEPELLLNGPGVTVRAVRTGETQVVKNTREDEDYVSDLQGKAVYLSELAVPVKICSEVVAVINVESEKLNAFSEEDRSTLEILSMHISSTLQRIKNLDELKKSEKKYRTLLESSLNAVFVIRDNKYVYVNKRAAELLGFNSPSELIGLSGLRFFPEEYRKVIESRVERLLKGEILPKYDAKLLRRDGTEVYVELNSTMIEYEGKPAILCFVNDVSDRKSLEEKLSYQNAQLKRIVEEKTNELLDAEKMAAVGKITSMITHDLRSPLQTIKNSIYLLQKKPENQNELLSMIEKATDNAIKMLEEVRDKIKETPPRRMKTNLIEILNEAIKSSFIPANINVILTISDNIEFVVIDETQIRRVIDNLIQNAIEAMKGYGQLKINARKESDKVILEVADSGPGLSEEAKLNLFRPFFTTKKNGTGLGLYYCKRVIEANKGTISVESRAGEGTIFRIELPLS
ncbi:PAS domain S-box protein, partial [Candidatus Bathyarchaeota archaeon]|nr:PAS domain S-box protein [Candidatus Bathyarchaeota archaeon]